MINKDKLIELINLYIDSPYKEEIVKIIEPSIRLKAKTKEICVLGSTKLGGIPNLPDGFSWPINDQGINMMFVAQIRLSELTLFDLDGFLPSAGFLFFFLDLDHTKAKVLYSKNEDKLKVITKPNKVKSNPAKLFKFFRKSRTDFLILKETKLSAEVHYSIPAYNSLSYAKIQKKLNPTTSPVESILDENYFLELLNEGEDNPYGKHQLLGHYRGIQNEYLEAFLENERYRDLIDFSIDEIGKLMNWKLLFQLDSDEFAGLNWGDKGKIHFFIEKDKLSKSDFSDIKFFFDTT